jgi:hypothetical protein
MDRENMVIEKELLPEGSFRLYTKSFTNITFDATKRCVVVKNGTRGAGLHWGHIYRLEADDLIGIRFVPLKSMWSKKTQVYGITADDEVFLFTVGRYWCTHNLKQEIESMIKEWGATTFGEV